MAYDRELADRLRFVLGDELGDQPAVEQPMFGGLAFLVGGNMAVAARGGGGLLVRVDPAESAALLAQPGVAPMEMGGRGGMAGWVTVSPEVVDDDEALRAWVARGVGYVRTLPVKAERAGGRGRARR